MGIRWPCLLGKNNDSETGSVSVIGKSLSSAEEGERNTVSVNLDGHDKDSTFQKSGASEETLVEQSMSFNRKELETSKSLAPPTLNKDCVLLQRSISFNDWTQKSSLAISGSFEHEAAVKLQKVYKSFRTRRKLADCAVLVEQSWWKLLDFTELKESSISFFDGEKHETAISRWWRARTRAAKVGKGLSKNSRAQKLALQHWLEAIDPRHRYGHNLHFYYVRWLQSQSREPFFYWLDLGEGKEMNLVEKCPRSKLQKQCIKYLGPMERKAYETELKNGKFFKKQTGETLDTNGGTKGAKWIFVLSTSRILYVGKKQKGTFQHSSFLAGGATSAAGQLVVENGILKAVWPHSGHYKPTEENFKDFISFLMENNVDLTNVQMTPVNEEHRSYYTQNSNMEMRVNSSEEHLTQKVKCSYIDQTNGEGLTKVQTNLASEELNGATLIHQNSRKQSSLKGNLTYLDIPTRPEFLQQLKSEDQVAISSGNKSHSQLPSPVDGYESAEEEEGREHEVSNPNSFGTVGEDDSLKAIHEKIIQRVNSRMDFKSYQLGKQLSCTWTSGAGPRIGCVRDYPSELQNHALEMLSLSPRRGPSSGSHSKSPPQYMFSTTTPKTFAHSAMQFQLLWMHFSHREARLILLNCPHCCGKLIHLKYLASHEVTTSSFFFVHLSIRYHSVLPT